MKMISLQLTTGDSRRFNIDDISGYARYTYKNNNYTTLQLRSDRNKTWSVWETPKEIDCMIELSHLNSFEKRILKLQDVYDFLEKN